MRIEPGDRAHLRLEKRGGVGGGECPSESNGSKRTTVERPLNTSSVARQARVRPKR